MPKRSEAKGLVLILQDFTTMTTPDYSKAKYYTLRLLSRREYSAAEITNKLKQKKYDDQTIEQLIIEIQKNNWQSDLRCAGMLLRNGINLGHGPNKIRYQMQQKGISQDIIEHTFENIAEVGPQADDYDIFWFELAKTILLKKANLNNKNDFKTRAKLKQFLYNRGFEHEHISYAIRYLEEQTALILYETEPD